MYEHDCELVVPAASEPLVVQTLEGERRRETTIVSYNILDAWHSGDRINLLIGLLSYHTHLSQSVILISDMQRMQNSVVMFVSYGAMPTVRDIYSCFFEFQSCDLFIGFMLHTCFEALWY